MPFVLELDWRVERVGNAGEDAVELAAETDVNSGLGLRAPMRVSSMGGGAEVGRSMVTVPEVDAIVVCISEAASWV